MDPRISASLRFIEAAADKKFSVSDVAKHVALSQSRFEHLLLQETHRTFRHHLRTIRMRKSKALLRDFTLGVKQVASLVGYSSAASFSRTFKKLYGSSAGESRRKRPPSRRGE